MDLERGRERTAISMQWKVGLGLCVENLKQITINYK
jgi:hypothetical protein